MSEFFLNPSRGLTLSGDRIMRDQAHEQNWLRLVASEVQAAIRHRLANESPSSDVLERTLTVFRREVNRPKHYGDNTPQKYSRDGGPVLPNPEFNYWDFFGYALSGYSSFDEFKRDLQLDESLRYGEAVALIGLLLIDSAIRHLNRNKPYRAARDVCDAMQASDEMVAGRLEAQLKEGVRRGGKARHRRTEAIKVEAIQAWKARSHRSLARFARQFSKEHLVAAATVENWIREFRKSPRS